MAATALHIVFDASPAGTIRPALSQLDRRERVLDLLDDMSLGPIASYDPELRAAWFDNELCEYDWEEITSAAASLPRKSIASNDRLIAWYAPNRAASYAGFKW